MKILTTRVSGYMGGYLVNNFVSSRLDNVELTHKNQMEVSYYAHTPTVKEDILEKITRLPDADVLVHYAVTNKIVSKNSSCSVPLSVHDTKNLLKADIQEGINFFIICSIFIFHGNNLVSLINKKSFINLELDYALNHFFAELIGKRYRKVFEKIKNFIRDRGLATQKLDLFSKNADTDLLNVQSQNDFFNTTVVGLVSNKVIK